MRDSVGKGCSQKRELGDRVQLAKQDVIDVLRKVGLPELVDEALRVLPDPVDTEQLAKWGQPHGINLSELIDRMGGSP